MKQNSSQQPLRFLARMLREGLLPVLHVLGFLPLNEIWDWCLTTMDFLSVCKNFRLQKCPTQDCATRASNNSVKPKVSHKNSMSHKSALLHECHARLVFASVWCLRYSFDNVLHSAGGACNQVLSEDLLTNV